MNKIIELSFHYKLQRFFIILLLLTPLVNFNSYDIKFLDLGAFYFYCISIIIIFFICLYFISNKDSFVFDVSTINMACYVTVCYIWFRFSISDTFSFSGHTFFRLFFFTFLFFTLKFFDFNHQKSLNIIICIFEIIAIVLAIYSILQFFKIITIKSLFEITGVFNNPSILTNYFCTVLPVSLAGFYPNGKENPRYKIQNIIGISSFILILIVIVLAKERTAWISAITGIATVIFMRNEILIFKLKKLIKKPAYIILTVTVIGALSILLYLFKAKSAAGRLLILKITFNIIKEHPLWGVGYDKFKAVYNTFQSNYFLSNPDSVFTSLADNIYFPFNEYLNIWAELGIIGLILALIIAFLSVKNGYLAAVAKPQLSGFFASFISILICALFSYPFNEISILINVLIVFIIIRARAKIKYTFIINKFIVKAVGILGIAGLIFITSLIIPLFLSQKKWEQAALKARAGNFSADLYKGMYPLLKRNPYFLYNYGVELSSNEYYEESIIVLEEANKLFTNSDILVYLADDYKAINNYEKAEELYKLAIYMVPKKFIPKYALMQLYVDTGNCNEAAFWAKQILETTIQVNSAEVDLIKKEAYDVLKERCEQ